MTGQADQAESDLDVRQWLNENLAHRVSQVVRYPPHAVVDAVADLGLPAPFDIGWSEVDHDVPSGITKWRCTVATEEHLVDVTAEAQRQGDRQWTGNDVTATTDYQREPVVSVEVSRLDDVCGLSLRIEGSRDSSSHTRPRQTWVFSFSGGEPREYVVGSREDAAQDGVEALCRRMAANI